MAVHFTFSVDYRKFRTLKWNSFSRHANVIMCILFQLPVWARTDHKLSTICHHFFSDSSPAYFSGILTVYPSSRQLHSSADTCCDAYFASPKLEQKPLANTVSPTVPQSNGICSLQCLSHSFLPCLQNCFKTHPYKQYHKWFQIVFLLVPHPQTPLYIPSVHPCVRVHVCECVSSVQKIQHDYRIIIFEVVMDTFLLLL